MTGGEPLNLSFQLMENTAFCNTTDGTISIYSQNRKKKIKTISMANDHH
jgi:hypothetical protein